MKRFLFFAWAMMMLTGCMKEDIDELRSQVQENTERITALEDAVAALEARLENGAMIKSVTPVSGEPGGWRIEFTEGSPASIEILNGASASAPDPGDNGVSPLIEVRTGAGGTVTLWYNITAGYPESGWTDTGVDLRGPQGPQGPQGSPGDNGEEGYPGNPGASAVSPQVRVVDSGNGRVTIQYNNTAGYPESGWTNAGDPIALDSNPRDKAAIFSIVENEATGTITITMNDSDVPEDRTAFDFAMASGAARFEWVGFNDKVTIEAGAEVQLKFVVNPSNAYVPTGEAAAIAGKWSLNLMDTRAGYVNEPENFTLVNITKEQEGLYVATIRCLEYDPDITDYAMALVLNTGTEAAPILISSPTFVLGAATSVEWSFDDGTLTITGTGAMPDYIDLDDIPWNVHRAEIETVVIADGVTSIGISAFNDCTALTGITIPASVTSIGEGAFYNCTSLTDVTIPDGVTSIERHTFHDCSALAHITIPNHVETIWDGAFESCIALESVTIGSGVTTIKWYVFSDCPTLKNVTCLATTPPTLDGYNFGGTGTDVLHVPAASVNAYKNVTVWNNAFASIEAI